MKHGDKVLYRGNIGVLSCKEGTNIKLPINYPDTHYSIRKLAREQYVVEQKGLCYHCKEPLAGPSKFLNSHPIDLNRFPVGMFDYPVHLHHCRKTHMTIGAVHAHCNAVLWQYHGE